MREIQSIALIGAGAIGALYASLFQTQGVGITIIASGERAERLRKNGFRVNETDYRPQVVDPSSPQASPHGLVLVAVKYHQLDEAIRLIKPFVGDDTIILSLLNGIDSEERIAKVYGIERLLYSYVVGTDAVREGNAVVYHNTGKIVFGERDGNTASDKVQSVKKAFDRGHIPCEVPTDMMRSMWWKFMVNVGVNQASALLGAPYGVFTRIEEAKAIMEAAMREVIAVSQKLTIGLNEKDLAAWYPVLGRLSPEGKTSMLQDMEAGRKTEVEMFAGTMVRLGRGLGVPVPVNELLFDAIRAREKMLGL
jgi:2-dehydropantoate 2-reductase